MHLRCNTYACSVTRTQGESPPQWRAGVPPCPWLAVDCGVFSPHSLAPSIVVTVPAAFYLLPLLALMSSRAKLHAWAKRTHRLKVLGRWLCPGLRSLWFRPRGAGPAHPETVPPKPAAHGTGQGLPASPHQAQASPQGQGGKWGSSPSCSQTWLDPASTQAQGGPGRRGCLLHCLSAPTNGQGHSPARPATLEHPCLCPHRSSVCRSTAEARRPRWAGLGPGAGHPRECRAPGQAPLHSGVSPGAS